MQVYGGDNQASNWVLCRSQLCKACGDTETYLHHIDCHAAIAARGHSLSLQELWTLGTWTRPVPGVPYQADVRGLLATAISSLGKESDAMLPEFSEICGLPWELREMIASHSIESPLWKILSALHRFGKVKKLLQHGEDEHVIDIANIKEWQRGIGGDMSGTAQNHSDMVRVYLDDYGIQRIEQFSSESASYTQARMHTATWYIVEPLSVMGNVQVHVKVSTLQTTPHKATTYQRHTGRFHAPEKQRLPADMGYSRSASAAAAMVRQCVYPKEHSLHRPARRSEPVCILLQWQGILHQASSAHRPGRRPARVYASLYQISRYSAPVSTSAERGRRRIVLGARPPSVARRQSTGK